MSNYSTAGWCSVPGCPCLEYEVYHHFPDDEILQDTWIQLITPPRQKKPFVLGRSPRVCSLHFNIELDYDIIDGPEGGLQEQPLKATAIPSIFPWSEKWIYSKKNGKSSSTKTPEKKVIKIEKPMLYSCQFCGFSSAFKCGWAQHQKKHSAQLEKGGKAAYPTQTHKNTKGDDQQTKRSIRKVDPAKNSSSHGDTYSSSKSSALKGGKLSMNPIVLLEKLSRQALREYY